MTGKELMVDIKREDHSTDIFHPGSLDVYVFINGDYKVVTGIRWAIDGEGQFLLLELEE